METLPEPFVLDLRPETPHGLRRPGERLPRLANLPAPLLAKLNADCVAALRRPEVVERHRTLGAEVATSAPEEARRFCGAEMQKWGEAARKAGIQPQ